MRRHISVEIKRQVLRLAVVRGYKYKRIRELTGVSERTTKRICALHRRIGDVVKKRTVDGGPRLLNGFHISVSRTFATRSGHANAKSSFLRAVLNDSPTCCYQSCKINLKVLVECALHPEQYIVH
jgi:hypothetical protein